MKLTGKLMVLFAMLIFAFAMTACDAAEDAAEKALEELTGFEWKLNEDEFEDLSGVDTPSNWRFLFAANLEDEETAELIDGDFDVDISVLEELGIDLGDIDNQVIMGRVAPAGDTGNNGLRYANKILIDGGKIKLDGESIEALGASVGSSGPGWYAAYLTLRGVGFVKGSVTDCDGSAPPANTVLVIASDGPFFTYAAGNGSWALPSIDGKPAAVNFDAGDCSGSSDAPVSDEENPKDPGSEPPNDPLEDDTNVVDDGETDLGDEGIDPPPVGDVANLDFEYGTAGWESTGNDCFGVYDGDYGELFPGGDETKYGFITSGGNNRASCTVSRTVQVPAGASKLVVSYNYISQEYIEWLNSAYNDMGTVLIQGQTEYIVHRTINDVAFDDAWTNLGLAIGNIDTSADSNANDNPGIFDGQLNWGSNDGDTPRGGSDDETDAGRVAEFAVNSGDTVTLLITVSDVGDTIYDSALVIDYFEFQ